MNKRKQKFGFTLIELVVAAGLIGVLSTVIVFSGSDSRNRHRLQDVYNRFELALSEAVILSRSQQVDTAVQQNVHVVVLPIEHTISLYFDGDAGTAGEFDAADTLEEQFVYASNANVLVCGVGHTSCAVPDDMVITWPHGGGEVVMEAGSSLVSPPLYVQMEMNNQTINATINALGVMEQL